MGSSLIECLGIVWRKPSVWRETQTDTFMVEPSVRHQFCVSWSVLVKIDPLGFLPYKIQNVKFVLQEKKNLACDINVCSTRFSTINYREQKE